MSSYTGLFSLFTLTVTVVTVLYSLVLMVVLIVLGMTGRLRAQAPAAKTEPEPPAPDTVSAFRLAVAQDEREAAALAGGVESQTPTAPIEAEAPPAAGDAANTAPQPPAPRYKTGLWQLLASMLACAPALAVQNLTENIYGRAVFFTAGTAVNLLLLAGQIFLSVWLVRLQRRLPY